MNLREGVLDSLIDDGESIVQIMKYLKFLNISFNKIQLIQQI